MTDNEVTHLLRGHATKPKNCTGKTWCNNYGDKGGRLPGTSEPGDAAVHHVVPVSAVMKYAARIPEQDKQDAIMSLYKQMEWCINKDDNLVWLPYFRAFQRHLAGAGATRSGGPDGFAAHDFDHAKYTIEVIDTLEGAWKAITAPNNTDKCKATTLAGDFNNVIQEFAGKIKKQNSKILDDVHALKQSGAVPDTKELEKKFPFWWAKFTMSQEPKRRPVSMLFSDPSPRKQKITSAVTR